MTDRRPGDEGNTRRVTPHRRHGLGDIHGDHHGVHDKYPVVIVEGIQADKEVRIRTTTVGTESIMFRSQYTTWVCKHSCVSHQGTTVMPWSEVQDLASSHMRIGRTSDSRL